jgi:hypothetical protein
MDYVFCLLHIVEFWKMAIPIFGATCNFNDQILPDGILFLAFQLQFYHNKLCKSYNNVVYLSFDIYNIFMTSCQALYWTIEKGECAKNFFCNYRLGLSLSTHRPVTTKNPGKYDSIGDKNEKRMCTHKTSYNWQLLSLRTFT